MSDNRQKIFLYSTKQPNQPPNPDNIDCKELAINYSNLTEGGGELYIKNDINEIITFPSSKKINNNINSKIQIVHNTTVSEYQQITDINNTYNFYSDITINNLTANDYAEIIFGLTDALSGNFAPICETFENTIRIYSKSANIITIPTIIIIKNSVL